VHNLLQIDALHLSLDEILFFASFNVCMDLLSLTDSIVRTYYAGGNFYSRDLRLGRCLGFYATLDS
jgi:hypothetical protein